MAVHVSFRNTSSHKLMETLLKRKRLKKEYKILICVAKTEAEPSYLLDFNLALSLESESVRKRNREKRKSSTDRLKYRRITTKNVLEN